MRLTWLGIGIGIAALTGACYDPPRPICGFRCGPNGECPDGYACDPDNRCHREDVLVFCGNGDDAALDDSPTVFTVDCPPVPNETVIIQDFEFVPSAVAIPVNGIIHFTLPFEHRIVSDDDTGFRVSFGNDACLQFTKPGTLIYRCDQHAIFGSVTVQPQEI